MQPSIDLISLFSSKSYFTSEFIFQELTNRLIGVLYRAEEFLNTGEDISKILNELSDATYLFLFRSGPVQILIERIENLLYHDTPNIEDVSTCYILFKQILMYVYENQNKAILTFFEISQPLTEPFALSVIAFDPNNVDSDFDKWNECSEINKGFYSIISKETGKPYTVLRSFTPNYINDLKTALSLISTFFPYILYDLSINLKHICLYDIAEWNEYPNKRDNISTFSCSDRRLLSCIFLSVKSFVSVHKLFEAIFHEALHLKYFNATRALPLYKKTYRGSSNDEFKCPWRKNSARPWKFDRTFAAFHVYVHLFVAYKALLQIETTDIPQDWIIERTRICFEKANIISEWIDVQYDEVMQSEGKNFYSDLKQFLKIDKE
jgi:hypothetical protein